MQGPVRQAAEHLSARCEEIRVATGGKHLDAYAQLRLLLVGHGVDHEEVYAMSQIVGARAACLIDAGLPALDLVASFYTIGFLTALELRAAPPAEAASIHGRNGNIVRDLDGRAELDGSAGLDNTSPSADGRRTQLEIAVGQVWESHATPPVLGVRRKRIRLEHLWTLAGTPYVTGVVIAGAGSRSRTEFSVSRRKLIEKWRQVA